MANFLTSLELSARAHSACVNYLNVNTAQDFLALKFKEVIRTPYVGRKTWNEIAEKQEELRQNGSAFDPKVAAAHLVGELNAVLDSAPSLLVGIDNNRRVMLYERLT